MTEISIIQGIITYFSIGFLSVWIMLRIPGLFDKENEEDIGTLIATVFLWPIVNTLLIIAGIIQGIRWIIVNEFVTDHNRNDIGE